MTRHRIAHLRLIIICGLLQSLSDEQWAIREDAARALARMGDSALPHVLRAMADKRRAKDPQFRQACERLVAVLRAKGDGG